jgi:hypothetical protein
MKECIAEILPQCREHAETLFRSAQASFISGDLTTCLDLLGRNAGIRIRCTQAKELAQRMKQKILQRSEVDPNDNEMKLLFERVQSLARE